MYTHACECIGWHLKYDQWLNVKGNLIRPFGRHKPSTVLKKTREQVRSPVFIYMSLYIHICIHVCM